ncbi:predicted protein [Pyrenophora tritici-repentis Pt-1C-BFP]|uniref:Uncharacterized protein n=1 Tax=Pyrenophora tritici-repentis (strain Pt-1C-BFP) TaxID=426418 RepID=B2VZS5_PYRTR|nr:uncharacterized protein PTRG_02915 [Pyrenophora tritici-repentis Pt-1C-BFP]EDU45438.1 predicted protein [Pyrenophora tritici-repentis Pt-1C-BFP]
MQARTQEPDLLLTRDGDEEASTDRMPLRNVWNWRLKMRCSEPGAGTGNMSQAKVQKFHALITNPRKNALSTGLSDSLCTPRFDSISLIPALAWFLE